MTINGKKIAEKILDDLKNKPTPRKTLVAVLVGEDPGSVSYVGQKGKFAKSLGVDFRILKFKVSIPYARLETEIEKLNRDEKVGGMIVQLPLPVRFSIPPFLKGAEGDFKKGDKSFSRETRVLLLEKRERNSIIDLIDPKKDVDNLTGQAKVPAPTVGALQKIFKTIRFNPKGKKAAVVGKGVLVGEPVAKWLKRMGASVQVFDRNNFDKKELAKAELIVSGAGKPRLINGNTIKKDAVLIDFGYGRKDGQVSGDIDFESCRKKTKWITPTPGGTGPIVVAQLFENFYKLAA